MKVYANAKINLCLDVTGKRDDGYHNVCMIMQEITLCDILDIEITDSEDIVLMCDSQNVGQADDNLCTKAALLFFEKTGIKKGCSISLKKNIPVCAGLGGGSSDAACVLKTLNTLCHSPLSDDELASLGLTLGADVPFFIKGKTALCEGIGEILTPIASKEKFWVALIKPDADISTKEAYKRIDSEAIVHPDTKKATKVMEEGNMNELYKLCSNVFEDVSIKDFPQIKEIKEHFMSKGAKFSMMSGSGPTVFGIFDTEKEANEAFISYGGKIQGGGVAQTVV
ncbi:MAG: 4-(cytidine 5'-diphospho)-2-C-methyl-D-erythritol kinase [Ruminococcaceae bacterium]|nr:4-(cytidine 5'-diphospho)-2-C-methyl-D-erythritol kinase [Oscillospiraceae bacterium]